MATLGTFNYAIPVAPDGHGGYIPTGDGYGGNPISLVDDIDNGGGDDLNQLGDVSGDQFHIADDNSGRAYTYLGKTSDGQGVVAKFMGGSSWEYYLYTNNSNLYNYAFFHPGASVPEFVASDGTSATATPVCFATGTRIKTTCGEVAVEDLHEGQDVITASGEKRPIQWIGQRRTDCAKHPCPKDVWPVLVQAGALGRNTPDRDLYLTPYHAVALTCGRDVLVPVHALINGTTIRQVPVDEITYWHVELESHDILIANGARAESYLDTGNRAGFENADSMMQLHPSFEAGRSGDFCLPMLESGPVIAAIRASLPENGTARAA